MIEESCSSNKRLVFHVPFMGTIPSDLKPPSSGPTFKAFPTSHKNACDLEGPSIYMQTDFWTFLFY